MIHVEIRSLQVNTVADAGSMNIGSTLNIVNQREQLVSPRQPQKPGGQEEKTEVPNPPETQPPIPTQPGPPIPPPAGAKSPKDDGPSCRNHSCVIRE